MEYRLGCTEDLAACRSIVSERQPQVLGDIPQEELTPLWANLLAAEQILFYVVVPERSAAPVSFHMTAFIGEEIVDELRRAERLGVAGQLLARHAAGERVFREPGEIAVDNAKGGLNMLVLHCPIDVDDLTSPRAFEIASASARGFFFTHSGFRARRIIEEVFDDQIACFLEAGGMRPWDEYQAPPNIAPGKLPRFYGMRAEQVTPGAASPWGEVFHCRPPRFHFTRSEQRVLNRALLDSSDNEIANELGISLSAVRQAWRGIFQRIARVDPVLLDAGDPEETDLTVRGKEKRRRILAYLRQHLQELRPYSENGLKSLPKVPHANRCTEKHVYS